jgi:hypothetical protein
MMFTYSFLLLNCDINAEVSDTTMFNSITKCWLRKRSLLATYLLTTHYFLLSR